MRLDTVIPKLLVIASAVATNLPGQTIAFDRGRILPETCPILSREIPRVADFNGDGLPDILVRTNGSSLAVFPGVDKAKFGQPVAYELTDGPAVAVVAVGDFNGDGRADLVVNSEIWLSGADFSIARRVDIKVSGDKSARTAL